MLLGPRIRQLRRAQGLTLQALGRETGLTHAFLSQVERGIAQPSLRTLGRITSVLGVTIASLLQLPDQEGGPRLTRLADPDSKTFSSGDGSLRMTLLTGTGNNLQAFMADGRLPPMEIASHPGEELVVSLEGRLEIGVDGTTYPLEAGDALVFDGSLPHEYRTVGHAQARFLVIVVGDRNALAGSRLERRLGVQEGSRLGTAAGAVPGSAARPPGGLDSSAPVGRQLADDDLDRRRDRHGDQRADDSEQLGPEDDARDHEEP